MKYYYKNPDANASTFAFGWFRSGDEGFFRTDPEGRRYFFITGRIKELIIRGGVNLAPLEIDEVINSCPGVKSGIAVGFDNDWYGEEVGALVMRADATLTEEQVLQHCRAALPFSKCPKVVVFSDSIPVTSTGKYQRNKVKHLFEEWKSLQFKQ
jgi:long-chain acyl-CoA synthetase